MLELVIAAVAVGLDNFGAAIGIGAMHGRSRYRWQVAGVFGVFEAGMPVLGIFAGRAVAGQVAGVAPIVGGVAVGLMGVAAVVENLRRHTPRRADLGFGRLLVLGLVLSLDNLAVGFGLGSIRVSIVLAIVVIGVVSVALSLAGLELGERIGERMGDRGELAGGVALMIVGVLIGLGLS